MTWQKIVDTNAVRPDGTAGYVGWLDEGKADGWFQRAAYLASDAAWRACNNDPRAQTTLIRDLWQALAYGYQACDLPPWCEPAYREAALRAWGRGRLGPLGGSHGYGTEHWLNLVGGRSSSTPPGENVLFESAWADYHHDNPANDGSAAGVLVVVQCALDDRAQLSTLCLDGPDSTPGSFCDFAFASPSECQPDRSGLRVWGPKCRAWRHPAWGTIVLLPRLIEQPGCSYDVARSVAQSCASRGARQVVDDGVKNAFLLDVATALEYHLLPEELVQVAAHTGVNFTHYNGNGPRPPEFDQAFIALEAAAAVFAGVTTAAGYGWLGALVGLAVSGADLFTQMIGAPTLVVTDQFGRIEPVFQARSISGTATRAPTQSVPDPPAGPHAAIISPLALLPTLGSFHDVHPKEVTGLESVLSTPLITITPGAVAAPPDANASSNPGAGGAFGGGGATSDWSVLPPINPTPTGGGLVPLSGGLVSPPVSPPTEKRFDWGKAAAVAGAGAAVVSTGVAIVRSARRRRR